MSRQIININSARKLYATNRPVTRLTDDEAETILRHAIEAAVADGWSIHRWDQLDVAGLGVDLAIQIAREDADGILLQRNASPAMNDEGTIVRRVLLLERELKRLGIDPTQLTDE